MATDRVRSLNGSSLSYLATPTTASLRMRKSTKNTNEISEDISQEMKATESRQGDVLRQISDLTYTHKQILAEKQELNFRIQNVDENRQVLYKRMTEWECKTQENKQKEEELIKELKLLNQKKKEANEKQLQDTEMNLKNVRELQDATLHKKNT